jgi:hypothetical protein
MSTEKTKLIQRFDAYQSTTRSLLIQKQKGQGSEVFEERSVVLLHEHRENKTDAEIRRLSINKSLSIKKQKKKGRQ